MNTETKNRNDAMERLKMVKQRKVKSVEELKQILTEISIRQTGKKPTHFEIL